MNEDTIKNEILQGLHQVDDTFAFTEYYTEFDSQTRKCKVSFKAVNEHGDEISEVIDYA